MAEKEYWRWPEYRRKIATVNWQKAEIITAGIDIGSVSSKAVVICDNEIYAWGIIRTGSNSPDSAVKILNWVLEIAGLKQENIHYIVGTGYGRINAPMAQKTVTEISCHAKGAVRIWGPSIKTILDVGGQDLKAIRIDEKGNVLSFVMNDKCAAGTGRGMELLADMLAVPIEEIGPVSLSVDKEPPSLNCTCVVFAKSEALALLRKGWQKEKVLAAYCSAMSRRMHNLLNRVGLEKEFVITGGQSKNIGIAARLEKLIGFKSLPIPNWAESGLDPMIAGAIGAAIFAKAFYEKAQKK